MIDMIYPPIVEDTDARLLRATMEKERLAQNLVRALELLSKNEFFGELSDEDRDNIESLEEELGAKYHIPFSIDVQLKFQGAPAILSPGLQRRILDSELLTNEEFSKLVPYITSVEVTGVENE